MFCLFFFLGGGGGEGGRVLIPRLFTNASVSLRRSCPQTALQAIGSDYLTVLNNTCLLFVLHTSDFFETTQHDCITFVGTLAMPKTKGVNDFLVWEMRKLNVS